VDGYFDRVYAVVEQIPEGRVTTYGQIASLLGNPRGARTVAWAMASTPDGLDIPCHRVVSSSGSLAPAHVFGGPGVQRERLSGEGITFLPSGRIDMKRHFWEGPEDLS